MRPLTLGIIVLTVAPFTPPSRADVVTGIGPSANPGVNTASLDLDGDGQPDIQASAMFAFAGSFGIDDTSVRPAPGSTLQFTGPLTTGTAVDNSLTFSSSGGVSQHAEMHVMNPSLNRPGGFTDGVFGFRFTSAGATHYGWAYLFASAGLSPYPVGTSGVGQWAYQSEPNTPISVGTVPEPASAAGLLAAAPALLRRCRPR